MQKRTAHPAAATKANANANANPGRAVWSVVLRCKIGLGGVLTALLFTACGGNDNRPSLGATSASGGADSRAQILAANPASIGAASGTNAVAVPASQRDAVRLADQATFGGTETLINSIRSQGIEGWVAAQLASNVSRYTSGMGSEIHQPQVDGFCESRPNTCWRDHYSTVPLAWDFYRNAMTQPDQLRQRVAFALAQILVISGVEAEGTYGFREYHNMLLGNALGNYREVLRKVALSPLMGEYLDHVNNDKISPNENFARELLQLFAVGTCKLNPDGSLDGGRCMPTYDNKLVRDYAFAMTGWTYPAGGSSVWGCWPTGANCTFLTGDMTAKTALADDQPRSLLSGINVPASRSPAQALNLVLDSLMAEPSMAPFIGKQLIQQLVKSNPTPAYVLRVSNAFKTGRFVTPSRSFGAGLPGDLTATVAAVLLDSEARNTASSLRTEKLREPVLMMTGMLRALNGRSDGAGMTYWWGDLLRQHVFRSPSVFNFYPPTYPVTGTGLVGPAFGIYNVNTAFSRLNFINQMLYWGGMNAETDIPNAIGSAVDLSAFEADAADAALLVDRLDKLATGGRISKFTRANIITAVQVWDANQSSTWRNERVRAAAYLIFASPAYQVLN